MTNPIFEASGSWDLLFDVSTGRVIISKDIHNSFPASSAPGPGVTPVLARSGTLKADAPLGNDDDTGRTKDIGQKTDIVARSDCSDNLFVEDVMAHLMLHL